MTLIYSSPGGSLVTQNGQEWLDQHVVHIVAPAAQEELRKWRNLHIGSQGSLRTQNDRSYLDLQVVLRYHVVFMEWRLYMREGVFVSRQDVPTVQASCLCNLYIVKTATGQQYIQWL